MIQVNPVFFFRLECCLAACFVKNIALLLSPISGLWLQYAPLMFIHRYSVSHSFCPLLRSSRILRQGTVESQRHRVEEITWKATFQNQRLHCTDVFLFAYSYVKLSLRHVLPPSRCRGAGGGEVWLFIYQTHSHSCEKRLLVSSRWYVYVSVCPFISKNNSAPIGRINHDV